MSETLVNDKLSDRELDLKLYGGLEVVKSQQSEINRRIGELERRLEVSLVDPKRVTDLETWQDEVSQPTPWKDYIMQAVGWGIGITLLAAVAKVFGVEVVW